MSGPERMPESPRAGLTRFSPGLRSAARGWSRRVAGLAALAAAVAVFASASPHAQTLTQALAETYNTNPQLLAQRALLRATDEQVPQALSFWRPQVTFTGQVGIATASLEQQPNSAALAAGRTRSVLHAITRPDALTFQLTQPVYRGGRTEAQTRQAINTVESTRAQTLAVETTVFQAVAQAYLDVVRDQTLVLVQRNNEYVLGRE